MPSVSGYSSTTSSIQWIIDGLMYPAYQYTNFQIELWRGSSHVDTINWTSGASQSYSMNTFYGLSSGTQYRAKAWTRYLNGPSTYIGEAYYSTEDVYVPPPPQRPDSISSLSLSTSSTSSGRISAWWPHANGATNYRVEVYRYNTSILVDSFSTYGTNSAEIYNLLEGTRYDVKVYGQNNAGNGGEKWANIETSTFGPGNISWVTATPSTQSTGKVTIDWGAASNATNYRVEIYTSNGSFVTSGGTSSRSYEFYLSEYTLYYAKVYAQRNSTNGSSTNSADFRTADLTAPVLRNVAGSSLGQMSLTFDATDSGSGMRPTSTYYTEISNSADSTAYGQGAYSTNKFRTFTTNGLGGALIANSYYNMRVTAYDASGNGSQSVVRVQYKITRPLNWNWHTAKVKGQNFNTTAAEWNSFCTRINQFRIYKGYGNYDFTDAIAGQRATANQASQARTAINTMNSSVPSVPSGEATANFVNSLQSALNAIS